MRSHSQKKRRTKSQERFIGERVSHWALTDVGLKREVNEDSYLADSDLRLYIVADGMGGHAGGGTASKLAVNVIRRQVLDAFQSDPSFSKCNNRPSSQVVLKMLDEAIHAASERIYNKSNEDPELAGMGTTVTALLVIGGWGYVAHVGDSRLYLLRQNKLLQRSEDHSLVNEQIKAGFITEEEAQHSRFRNIITRSVGFERHVMVDTFCFELKPADVFLMCSDGLTGMVGDGSIKKQLTSGRLSDVTQRLVTMANASGGDDNITVIVVRYLLGRKFNDQSWAKKKRRKKEKNRRKK